MTEPVDGSPADQAHLAIRLQGSMLTSSLVPPTVTLDGRYVSTSYGTTTFPVAPGRHQVDVACEWIRRYGQAQLDVDVESGETVTVFYAAPFHQFTTGSIGLEKQKAKGLWVLLTILAVAFAVPVVSVLLVF